MNNLFNPGGVHNLANLFLKCILTIGAIVGAVATITKSSLMHDILKWDNFQIFISGIQLFFALIIIALGEPTKIGWDANLNDKKIIESKAAFPHISKEVWEKSLVILKTQFSKWWKYLWASWALFYLYLTITLAVKKYYNATNGGDSDIGITIHTMNNIIGNSLNLISSFCLMRLYFILMYKANTRSNEDNPDFDNHEKDVNIVYHRKVSATAFLFLFVIVTEFLLYFSIALIDKRTFNSMDKISLQAPVAKYFQIINGVLASVSLSFFVARLFGSVTTQLPRKNQLVLPALFTYCAIQPFYPVIVANGSDDGLKMVILFVALVGKYILYVATTSLIENKFILYYLARTIELHNQMKHESRLFSKIWEPGTVEKPPNDNPDADVINSPLDPD